MNARGGGRRRKKEKRKGKLKKSIRRKLERVTGKLDVFMQH